MRVMWTKEDDKQYKKLVKEGKNFNEIQKIMGSKLKEHPRKFKNNNGKLYIHNYTEFIYEMIYTPLVTVYKEFISDSSFNNKNIQYWFETNSGQKYVLEFIHFIDNIGPYSNRNLYNVSFTTKEQYEMSEKETNISLKEFIYENPTGLNEYGEVIQRVIYLFKEFHKNYGQKNLAIYVIGITEDPIKIKYYLNLINDSIPGISKIEGKSSINKGKNVWYFEP